MWMTVGNHRFAITLADTEAAHAFAALLPLTLQMEELNGNEKKKELPHPLPTDTIRPGTIRNGDILLWGARTVVVFYLTFDSPYSYTRLGRVDDPAGLAQAQHGLVLAIGASWHPDPSQNKLMLSVPRRKRAWFAGLWANASAPPVIPGLQGG